MMHVAHLATMEEAARTLEYQEKKEGDGLVFPLTIKLAVNFFFHLGMGF